QRHAPAEARIFRQIHFAHPAPADQLLQTVHADRRAWLPRTATDEFRRGAAHNMIEFRCYRIERPQGFFDSAPQFRVAAASRIDKIAALGGGFVHRLLEDRFHPVPELRSHWNSQRVTETRMASAPFLSLPGDRLRGAPTFVRPRTSGTS